MHPASRLLLTAAFLLTAPGLVSTALAHGGQYRGPAGEVPTGSRDPSDPPPPPEGDGPTTPGGETEGPTTPGDGGPGGGPTSDGGGSNGGPSPGGGPAGGGGPPTGGNTGGRSRGAAKGPGYAGWVFWWNFNKDDLLGLRGRLHRDAVSGQAVKAFSRRVAEGRHVRVTRAAIDVRVIPALRALFEQDDLHFDTRSAVALALAKAGDLSIVPQLRRMVRNEDKRYTRVVEESAALALGILGERDAETVEFLIEILEDPRRNASFVRPFAAVSLGLLGGDAEGRSREALLGVLARKEKKNDVKPAALLALGLLEDERAVAPLLEALAEKRLPVEGAARLRDAEMPFVIEALGRIGAPGIDGAQSCVVDQLMRRVAGRRGRSRVSPNERRSAVIALGRIAPQCEPAEIRAVGRTLRAAAKDDRDSSVRNFAMIALGRIAADAGTPADMRTKTISALAHHLESGRPAILAQPFAALAMGLIARADDEAGRAAPEEKIRMPLREKFAAWRGDPKARGAYAIASGLAADPLATEGLLEVLTDRGMSLGLRGQSAVAIGMIGDSSARSDVRDVLAEETDRELRVRTAVAAGLLGDSRAVAELVEILRSGEESQYVLGSVSLALGQIGDERALDPLLEIVVDTKSRFPDLTRALAAVALGQIAERRDVPALAAVTRDLNFRAIGASEALLELVTIL